MKGFMEHIIQIINETELEIALDLAHSNRSREELMEEELFNLLPESATEDTEKAIRDLLELL